MRKPSLTWLAGIVLALAVFAQLGPITWIGDLIAVATDTYLWVALALLAVFALRKRWRPAAACALAAALCAAQIGSVAPAARATTAPSQRPLRIVVYNMHYLNSQLEAAVAEAQRHDADMIFLMEYSFAMQQRIEGMFPSYLHRLIQPSQFTMGLALFSRIPLDDAQVRRGQNTLIPVFDVRFAWQGRPVSLVAGHPWPPQPQWGGLHARQLASIVDVAVAAPKPLIVLGDFNAAPWSQHMRALSQQAGVRNARPRFDISKTFFPAPLIGLPLDHALVSDDWLVVSLTNGNTAGSDHVPVVLELTLTR